MLKGFLVVKVNWLLIKQIIKNALFSICYRKSNKIFVNFKKCSGLHCVTWHYIVDLLESQGRMGDNLRLLK